MSRTNHHRSQPTKFGSGKFSCNKQYNGVTVKEAKVSSHKQMRCEGKSLEQEALVALREGDYLFSREDVDGIDGSGICERCLGNTWLGDCYSCEREVMERGDNTLYEFPVDWE